MSTTTSSVSPSRQPARSAASGEYSTHSEVARTTQASAAAIKTPDASAKKRKVSFDDLALAAPEKPAERRVSKKVTAVTPVAPAETAETPAAPKPVSTEEPPRKKKKQEAINTKNVQPAEAAQSSAAKASETPKPKPKRSVTFDHGSEVGIVPHMDVSAHIGLLCRRGRAC